MSDLPLHRTMQDDEIDRLKAQLREAEEKGRVLMDMCRDLKARVTELSGSLQGSVPEGWRLVPVEPTKSMLCAAEKGIRETKDNRKGMTIREWSFAKAGYVEMLAAAPQPPKDDSQ